MFRAVDRPPAVFTVSFPRWSRRRLQEVDHDPYPETHPGGPVRSRRPRQRHPRSSTGPTPASRARTRNWPSSSGHSTLRAIAYQNGLFEEELRAERGAAADRPSRPRRRSPEVRWDAGPAGGRAAGRVWRACSRRGGAPLRVAAYVGREAVRETRPAAARPDRRWGSKPSTRCRGCGPHHPRPRAAGRRSGAAPGGERVALSARPGSGPRRGAGARAARAFGTWRRRRRRTTAGGRGARLRRSRRWQSLAARLARTRPRPAAGPASRRWRSCSRWTASTATRRDAAPSGTRPRGFHLARRRVETCRAAHGRGEREYTAIIPMAHRLGRTHDLGGHLPRRGRAGAPRRRRHRGRGYSRGRRVGPRAWRGTRSPPSSAGSPVGVCFRSRTSSGNEPVARI